MNIKPIPIPGTGVAHGKSAPVCIEYGDDAQITITTSGCLYRSKEGDDFNQLIPKGYLQKDGKVYDCDAPSKDETVTWIFIDRDGNLTEGEIDVCKDCQSCD